MSSRFGASPWGPCHHSHRTRGLRRLSPRGSRSTSTSTSVPTTIGRGPRLPRPLCAQTFGCILAQARSQTDKDLARTSLEPLLQLHRIVARVEDEQRSGPLLLRFLVLMREAHKRSHLLGGHLVGVLPRVEALYVYGGGPTLADEVELCNELVSPSGHDRLSRR